jgi:hypothetical protein
MNKLALAAVTLAGSLAVAAAPANAEEYNSSSSYSQSTTVINTTNNNTVINNRYGGRGYNRYGRNDRYRPYYNPRPVYHPPSNQVQFRVPVRVNIFGSNIDLDINSGGYGYYRH